MKKIKKIMIIFASAVFLILAGCGESASNNKVTDSTTTTATQPAPVKPDPVELLKDCKYEEALPILKEKAKDGSSDAQNLYYYALGRSLWDKDWEKASRTLYRIYPNYGGELSDEIEAFMSGKIVGKCTTKSPPPGLSHKQWAELHQYTNDMYHSSDPLKDAPAIGMTAEEVKESTWGEPEDINRTTTASGTLEQWIYHRDRYIYLQDGIVTTIQE